MWNHRNLTGYAKGKPQGQPPEGDSTDEPVRGGAPRSSVEASVMEVERRGRVTQVDAEVNRITGGTFE